MPYKDPKKANHYQREYRRIRRAGDVGTTPGTTPLPLPFRLQTVADIVRLLEEQIIEVRSDEVAGRLDKARCVGYLAGIALKAIEAGNLEGRLEALEHVFKQRSDGAAA